MMLEKIYDKYNFHEDYELSLMVNDGQQDSQTTTVQLQTTKNASNKLIFLWASLKWVHVYLLQPIQV